MEATQPTNEHGAELPTAILATLVHDHARLDCLPRFFGKHSVLVECAVFTMLDRMSQDYSGGYWGFYELSNGGFYMAPKADKRFRVMWEDNGFEGEVSADAAGIIACLMAFSHLSFQIADDCIVEAFHRLREFAMEHREAGLIFAAID